MLLRMKHRFRLKMALLGLLFFFCQPMLSLASSTAQSPPKYTGPKPIGLVNSSNGGVFKKGKYGIILKHITFDQDELYRGTDSIEYSRPPLGRPGKAMKEKSFNRFQATLRAGITENIDIRAVIPFMDKELERESSTRSFSDDNSGIGDIKVLTRYRIMSQKNKDPFNLALGIGLQIPTGDTGATDSSGKTPGYLQTGSGSWDPIIELGVHKVVRRHWFSTYFMYQMSTEGELGNQDFEKPDVFKYNFGYAYALSNLFDLQLELNGEVKSKAEKAGVKNNNSGGHMIFLTPGVHCKITKQAHFDLGVAIPIYRDVNGTQLTEDFRVISKLAFTF